MDAGRIVVGDGDVNRRNCGCVEQILGFECKGAVANDGVPDVAGGDDRSAGQQEDDRGVVGGAARRPGDVGGDAIVIGLAEGEAVNARDGDIGAGGACAVVVEGVDCSGEASGDSVEARIVGAELFGENVVVDGDRVGGPHDASVEGDRDCGERPL